LQDLNISSPSSTAILYIYSGECLWLDSADVLSSISFSAIIVSTGNGFFPSLYVSSRYDVRIKKKRYNEKKKMSLISIYLIVV